MPPEGLTTVGSIGVIGAGYPRADIGFDTGAIGLHDFDGAREGGDGGRASINGDGVNAIGSEDFTAVIEGSRILGSILSISCARRLPVWIWNCRWYGILYVSATAENPRGRGFTYQSERKENNGNFFILRDGLDASGNRICMMQTNRNKAWRKYF